MKTIRGPRARGCARVQIEGGHIRQERRPVDVAKEPDVAKEVRHPADQDKDVRRDIGGESNGNWGWLGLLGLAGLAGLLGRYRDGANRSGPNYTRDRK